MNLPSARWNLISTPERAPGGPRRRSERPEVYRPGGSRGSVPGARGAGRPAPLRSKLTATANLTVRVHRRGPAGELLLEREERISNKVPSAGRNILRDLLGNTGYSISSFEVGGDSSPTLDGHLQLGDPIFRTRIERRVPKPSAVTFEAVLSEEQANGETLCEAGLFADEIWYAPGDMLAGGGGRLFARAVYTAIEKDASVVVTFSWEITIGSE